MALHSIQTMVKNRLPFLTSVEEIKIEQYTLEQFYYLQKWTMKVDPDLEDESTYSGMQKMLIAELVSYKLMEKKVVENVGGKDGGAAEGAKKIKKGKADVVEAEFEYGKASDGTFLGMSASELLSNIASQACEYAQTLGYTLPMCQKLGLCGPYDVPPFLSFVPNCE